VNLKSRVVPGCTVQYKLRRWRKLLRAMHLFGENEVLSAVDVLPGLDRVSVKLPTGQKVVHAPVLGAEVHWRAGRKGEGVPTVSPARPLLAPMYSVQLLDIQVGGLKGRHV
jgi:hypothetical protein